MASHRDDDRDRQAVPDAPAGATAGRASAQWRGPEQERPGPAGELTERVEPQESQEPPRRYGSKAPAFVRRSPALHLAWRIAVLVVGAAVIAGGVLLLPLPGPGWVIIFAGLALLATEFVWAQRLLHWAKVKAKELAARAMDPRVRRRNTLVLVLLLVLLATGVTLYVWQLGWTLPW